MSESEEVKKIIDENTHNSWERFGNIAATPIPVCDVDTAAYQICQLFEVKCEQCTFKQVALANDDCDVQNKGK